MPIDVHSPTWKTILEADEKHRDRPMKKLRKHGTDHPTTEYQRGYLDALDMIQGLAEDQR
ncbi:hypothetical protein [Roseibium sp.]|uniref:hypothetical protein n=1 Tax=Roseibium sp. TaxID=1936156 RepID=UPI003B52C685